jgi:hypothetical protein
MRWRAALVAALVVAGRPATAQDAPLPSSTLDVRDGRGVWRPLWSSSAAPVVWRTAPLAELMSWKKGASGVEWGELQLKGSGEAWRTRLVVARVDPARVRLSLDTAFTARREAAWTLARVPKQAVLAINAGQFEATMPWGWVVLDGRRWLPPQHGPLSAALVQDSSGALRWIRGEDVARVASQSGPSWAFQSYPAVLAADSVLPPLRVGGAGVDVAHRDARAGVCLTRDGQLLIGDHAIRCDRLCAALRAIRPDRAGDGGSAGIAWLPRRDAVGRRDQCTASRPGFEWHLRATGKGFDPFL